MQGSSIELVTADTGLKTGSLSVQHRWKGGRSTPEDTLAQRQLATLDISPSSGEVRARFGDLERVRTVQDTLFELPDTGELLRPPQPLYVLTMVLCDHLGNCDIVQYMSHEVAALRRAQTPPWSTPTEAQNRKWFEVQLPAVHLQAAPADSPAAIRCEPSYLALIVPEWVFAHTHFVLTAENQLPPSYSVGPGLHPSDSPLPLVRPHDLDRPGFHVPFLRIPGDTLPAPSSATTVYTFRSLRRVDRCVSRVTAQMRGKWVNPRTLQGDSEQDPAAGNAWWRTSTQSGAEPIPKRSRAQRLESGYVRGAVSPRTRHASAIAQAAQEAVLLAEGGEDEAIRQGARLIGEALRPIRTSRPPTTGEEEEEFRRPPVRVPTPPTPAGTAVETPRIAWTPEPDEEFNTRASASGGAVAPRRRFVLGRGCQPFRSCTQHARWRFLAYDEAGLHGAWSGLEAATRNLTQTYTRNPGVNLLTAADTVDRVAARLQPVLFPGESVEQAPAALFNALRIFTPILGLAVRVASPHAQIFDATACTQWVAELEADLFALNEQGYIDVHHILRQLRARFTQTVQRNAQLYADQGLPHRGVRAAEAPPPHAAHRGGGGGGRAGGRGRGGGGGGASTSHGA